MLGQGLPPDEVAKRLVRLNNLERLHGAQKKQIGLLEEQVRLLKEENRLLREKNSLLERGMDDLKLQLEEMKTIVFGKKKRQSGHDDDFPPAQNHIAECRPKESYRRKFPREEDVTKTEPHPIDCCARCGGSFSEREQAVWFEEDIPLPQKKVVVRHEVEKGYCEPCGIWSPAASMPSTPVVLGQNVRRYVAYLSTVNRQSYAQIQDILKQSYDFDISQGEIWNILEKEGNQLRAEYERLKAKIRSEPSIHLDETAWKLQNDFERHHAWTMVGGTSQEAVFKLGANRGKGNADELVGDSKAVVVRDGYAAYDHLENDQQLCFAHPHRKLRDLAWSTELDGTSRAHCRGAYETFAAIYRDVGAARTSDDPLAKYGTLLTRLKAFTRPHPKDPAKLTRVKTSIAACPEEYLTCLRFKDVAADNNAAERSLRHLVIKRKTSFGSFSGRTAEIMSVLYSVLLSHQRCGTLRSYLLGL